MNLFFDAGLADAYQSPQQRTRILSERWVGSQAYCPNCGCAPVTSYPNNSRIADFFCPSCDEGYELKSQRRPFRTKIVDGSYPAMMERLAGGRNPNFLLLAYDARRLSVLNFFVVPKHFFSAEIIEKKRTLPATARRLDGLQHRSTRNPYRRTNFFSAQWYHRASGTSDGDVA